MRPLLIATLGLAACPMFAQLPSGHFEGAVSRDGSVQLVKADFDTAGAKLTGTIDIPELMDYEMPIPPVEWRGDTLLLWFNYSIFHCRYFPATGEITGISETWLPKLRLHLKQGGTRSVHFRKQEIAFDGKGIRLSGEIFTPLPESRVPYVVLVHGSGDAGRSSLYLHSLAYILAEHGIGVLLYDKRGCGSSTGDWKTASMGDLADDAVAALTYLRNRSDLKQSTSGFLGTSQGGWITAIAANRTPKCDFAVLNVGPSVSVFDQDMHRVTYSMTGEGFPRPAIDSAAEYTKIYFRYVRSRSVVDRDLLATYAQSIRGKDWADYVNLPAGTDDLAWWRNNDYDPAPDLQRLRCPVLSIFAELDVLVPPAENAARMDSLLRLSGTRHAIMVIPRVGHDGLTFQGLNGDTWKWPDVYWQWRKRPEMIIQSIVTWIGAQH